MNHQNNIECIPHTYAEHGNCYLKITNIKLWKRQERKTKWKELPRHKQGTLKQKNENYKIKNR